MSRPLTICRCGALNEWWMRWCRMCTATSESWEPMASVLCAREFCRHPDHDVTSDPPGSDDRTFCGESTWDGGETHAAPFVPFERKEPAQ